MLCLAAPCLFCPILGGFLACRDAPHAVQGGTRLNLNKRSRPADSLDDGWQQWPGAAEAGGGEEDNDLQRAIAASMADGHGETTCRETPMSSNQGCCAIHQSYAENSCRTVQPTQDAAGVRAIIMSAVLLVQVLHLCWLGPLRQQAPQLLQQSGSKALRLGPKHRPTSRAMERQQPMAHSSMDRPLQQLLLCHQSLVLVQVIWGLESYHCQRVLKLVAWHATLPSKGRLYCLTAHVLPVSTL